MSIKLSWDREENKKYLYVYLSQYFIEEINEDKNKEINVSKEDEIKNILRIFKKAGITDNDVCNVMSLIKNKYNKLLEISAEISSECEICESIYCEGNCV